ncbi:regulator of nucleoside diphosphate kinase [Nannocystis exedens]|uniref:Regulator of nucleoside diphosphate kinase n=1 Tax=Nannocystis exedens TaxID=54 RepID=A0A1I1ZTA9_9BACT|nr:nucleoside diphosphate kinase regulator [Nannocystis exedens]PCC75321.1 nucleoside diphosphate kinase regulator [Nannocystis exedens]SFE35024.1 regulator of nucleoside diphosphate kinase [Nannocystis exedens]
MKSVPPITISRLDLGRLKRLLSSPLVRGTDAADALDDELERAAVVDPEALPPHVVSMNSRVRLRERRSERELELTLVYPDDAGPDRVSVLAPVGSALLGLSVGQDIEWPLPGGRIAELTVLEILYQPEAMGDLDL